MESVEAGATQSNIVQYNGKTYRKVVVDGKTFMRNVDLRHYLESVGPDAQFNHYLDSSNDRCTVSDHVRVSGKHKDIKLASFNTSMNRMALRMKQGLVNADGPWKGFTTGTILSEDQSRREHVVSYLVYLLNRYDILFLQEIDLASCNMLTTQGVKLVFSEESHDCNRGGVAIVTYRPNIHFSDSVAVYDEWKDKKSGELRRKHIGVSVKVLVGSDADGVIFSLTNFHFDAKSANDSMPQLIRYLHEDNAIVGGDLNLNVDHVKAELKHTYPTVRRITRNDNSRRPYTIDGLFVVD